MSRPVRDPLAGIERLIVDATNLLYSLRSAPGAEPPVALIGRLRAVIPAHVGIELVFDGPPEPGSHGRIAAGLTVRYGGSRSADELILALVAAAERPAPGSDPTILVVSDDAALRRAAMARGAAATRAAWLLGRLARTGLSAPSVGRRRPPPSAPGSAAEEEPVEGTEARWRPGRRATVKRGNPLRRRRSGRRSRGP